MKLLADEAEAVEGYIKALEVADNEEVKSALKEIMDDEYNHIGKLTALITALDSDAGEKIAKGIEGE
jgi:rubrerythrin